jgi:hypothetical protein
LVFDNFDLFWSIKFSPLESSTEKEDIIKHIGSNFEDLPSKTNYSPLKEISPHVENYSPPFTKKGILPCWKTLYLEKHMNTRGNKT